MENTRLRAMADFPQADREVLALVQGSEDEIRLAAQKMHEKVQQQAPAVPPVPQPETPAPVPVTAGPAPSPSPGEVPPPQSADEIARRQMVQKVRSQSGRKAVEPHEAEAFFETEFGATWNDHIRERSTGQKSWRSF